jgi:nucleotide-binding universal stress UspA family protein
MNDNAASEPVVVGIDGSEAAITAAIWAATEAVHRDVPLRLVHAIALGGGPLLVPDGGTEAEREYAEMALRAVSAAVETTGLPVKIETEVRWGSSDTVLVDESRTAAMVCVGSTGIGAVSSRLLGSTAADVAQHALCPVAIIRTPHVKPLSGTDWIVVAIDDSAEDDAVVEFAMAEAALRHAPILAVGVWSEDFGDTPYDELDRRVQVWRDRHPEIHVHPVTTRATVAGFLAENTDGSVQLAVISGRQAGQVRHIIGPHRHPVVSHGYCSVVVVR